MYHDSKAPIRWQWMLVAAFAAMVLPNVWLPELVSREALNALIARDLHEFGNLVATTALGQPTVHPPLAAWCLNLISFFLPINEFSVRLVDILALAGLCVLCAGMILRTLGPSPAAVAAAACFSALVSLEKGTIGDGSMLFSLAINGAWFAWYHLSRDHKRWLYAWFFGHLLMCVAILAGGPKAIFYFYFPLLFLRRPLSAFRRMRQMDHLMSLFFFGLVIVGWVAMVPELGSRLAASVETIQPEQEAAGYLMRLLMFPLRATFGFMPWTLLVWPAFCMAFRPLEKMPVFAQFLRTLAWPLVIFFWLVPEGKPGALLPIVAPLSILVAINYDILVRRHGEKYVMVCRFLSWLTVVVAPLAVIWGIVLMTTNGAMGIPSSVINPSLVFLAAATGVAIWLLRPGQRGPVWQMMVLAMVGVSLTYVSIVKVREYVYDSPRRHVAELLVVGVPEDATIYELLPASRQLWAESFYLGRPVKRIMVVTELPKRERVVYLLARNQVPVTGDRDWTPVGGQILYENLELRVWRGVTR